MLLSSGNVDDCFSENAVSKTMAYQRYKRFHKGREDVKDVECAEIPTTTQFN